MSTAAPSPLFALQGDDGLRAIPPFLQPNGVEPVVPDVSGHDRLHGEEMDHTKKSSLQISTPVICVVTVIVILATAMLFWSIKRCRSARQQHGEDGSTKLERGDTTLNEKMKIGWRKLQGNRKRQSTWFDITTGQHFAEVLPSSSTICYITNVSTGHLLRDSGHPQSNSVANAYSEARDARRPFSGVSSEYSILGQQGFPLQVSDIRLTSNDETIPPIDFSPLSIYSQSSLPQGLCKPISPLRLKPKILSDEPPSLIPLQSTETCDPFQLEITTTMAERITKVRTCATSDSRMDSMQSPIDQGGKMQANRTYTVNTTSSWHLPSPSVTACIIRNSIYHHQSPPSKPRSKPPKTADSDSPAFEYDDSSPTARPRHVVSEESEDASSVTIGATRSELLTTSVVPAGLETAALSSRRDAPRVRRRTSHNVLSIGGSAASWSSDGNTQEFAQTLLEPKTEPLPTWTQARHDTDAFPPRFHPAILTTHSFYVSKLTPTAECDHAGDLYRNLSDLREQHNFLDSPPGQIARVGIPQNSQQSLLLSSGHKHSLQPPLNFEAMKQDSQRRITSSPAAPSQDARGAVFLPAIQKSSMTSSAKVPIPTAYLPEHGSSKGMYSLMQAMGLN